MSPNKIKKGKIRDEYSISVDVPKIDFNNVEKYCLKNNRFASLFLFSMSTMFPDGESNLIRYVKKLKSSINDENLNKGVELLIKQERNHLRIHNRFNSHVYRLLPVKSFVKKRSQFLNDLANRFWRSNKNNFKSISYRAYMFEKTNDNLAKWALDLDQENWTTIEKKLYLWHAIEEIEHSSVAEDLLDYFGEPNLLVRTERKLKTVFGITFEIFYRTIVFSWRDGLFRKLYFYREILSFLFRYKYFPKFFLKLFSSLVFQKSDSNPKIKKFVDEKFRFI